MIVYLHQATAYGAVERYLEQLLEGLDEEAVVIAPRSAELDPIARHAQVDAFDVSMSTLGRLFFLVRELRRLEPRLVHVVDVWPLAVIAARIARVPRIVVTHHTPELPRRDNVLGRLLWAASWRLRPEVIYTSAADRTADGRDGVVIPLGIDLERFAVDRRPEPIIGTVARLVPQKGLDVLLAAVPNVVERHPEVRVLIVGDGPLRAELERQAAGLPVDFAGEVADVPRQLARFQVFALPSRFEGLCLAVIEAQSVGVPVVATPVGGIIESVLDGETGLLVPVDDPSALAEAIVRLLDDELLSRRLSEAGRRQSARFSRAAMVHETLTFYKG